MNSIARGFYSDLRYLQFVAMAGCVMFCGCSNSPKLIPVVGSVTVKGKPAAGATILFHSTDPKAPTASGVVAADGTFSLLTSMKPGLPEGEYRVTVVWPDPNNQATPVEVMMGTAEDGPDLLKGKYASRNSSTLIVQITPSTTTLPPFEL